MGRRRRRTSAVEDLLALPWQASIICGVAAFVVLRWVVPVFFVANPVLSALAGLAVSFSGIALCGFCFIGLLSYLCTKMKGAASAGKSPPRREAPQSNVAYTPAGSRESFPNGDSAQPQTRASAAGAAKPRAWTLDALRSLEWKRFELLCAKYYEAMGFFSETLRCGPDGGIDVKLYRVDPEKPLAVVQCKAWTNVPVGVKEIRELLGVMAHEKIGRGVFVTTSSYTPQALEFGANNPLQLLDGPQFVEKLRGLPPAQQIKLLQFAFEGDYTTPTCASCGVKLVRRQGKRGDFWGCVAYPRCKTTMAVRGGT